MSNYPPGVSDNDFDLPSVGEVDEPLTPEQQDEQGGRAPCFSFDVWQCTNCGLVVTDLQYKMSAFDYECNCGRRLSTFRFVPARVKKESNETD